MMGPLCAPSPARLPAATVGDAIWKSVLDMQRNGFGASLQAGIRKERRCGEHSQCDNLLRLIH